LVLLVETNGDILLARGLEHTGRKEPSPIRWRASFLAAPSVFDNEGTVNANTSATALLWPNARPAKSRLSTESELVRLKHFLQTLLQ
jgi:hypothetical protein